MQDVSAKVSQSYCLATGTVSCVHTLPEATDLQCTHNFIALETRKVSLNLSIQPRRCIRQWSLHRSFLSSLPIASLFSFVSLFLFLFMSSLCLIYYHHNLFLPLSFSISLSSLFPLLCFLDCLCVYIFLAVFLPVLFYVFI